MANTSTCAAMAAISAPMALSLAPASIMPPWMVSIMVIQGPGSPISPSAIPPQITTPPQFSLLLEFENGERRVFDMARYIDQKPWDRLKSGDAFLGAFVGNGTVAWPGNIDDPETLYDRSVPLGDSGVTV